MPKEDTQFQPGGKPGPGRPPASEIEKRVKESLKADIAEAVEKVKDLGVADLEKFARNKKNKSLEIGVAWAYLHWYKTGDFTKVDKIFDRILGRSKQFFEHSGDKDQPLIVKQVTEQMANIQDELKKQLERKNE